MKKKLKLLIFLFCAFLLPGTLSSQTFEESVLYGDEAMLENDFYGAAMYYRNALYLDSTSLKAAWKYAEASRLFNSYEEAERFYDKVLARDNGRKYPLCRFWLAMMQKTNGKYAQAARNFSVFALESALNDEYYIQKAKQETEACRLALEILERPLDISIEHLLDVKVNTSWSEFNAAQLGDTALMFSALRPVVTGDLETFIPNTYVSKLYVAEATQAGWSRSAEMESRINVPGYHTANATVSADQQRMYFTRGKVENNPQLRTEIWYAERHEGKWEKPEKLNDRINLSGYTNTQPALSEQEDYRIIYFVSDRPGGFGRLDIWYTILKDGKYTEPVNLGSNINTPGDEITPFYHDSTQTLYFSSDYHPGLGAFDIFSSRGSLNSWTKPENVGYPLNTGYNDIYFTINHVDDDGYFTSNRPGSLYIKSETCCNDIYYYEWRSKQRVEIVQQITEPQKEDTVFDLEESIKMLLPLTLYFHNDEPNPRSLATSTDKNYKTTLSEYYEMKDLYKLEYSKGLTGFDKIKAEKDIEDFFENYIGKGFAQLKLFSKLLLMDLEKGSKVNIMIKGYCSPLTSTEYNVNLAMRRIASLKNYLREFDEGVFLPFLDSTASNGGVLRIHEDPIGESTASPFVSDNPNDKRNSIYSRTAAFERKIQIVLYESDQAGDARTNFPEIIFEKTTHNFGTLGEGTRAVCVFKFTNQGNEDLVLSGVETSCGCTMVDWSHEPIPPGGKGEISIFMKTDEDFGHRTETVTVLSNARQAKVVLTIQANIVKAIPDDR